MYLMYERNTSLMFNYHFISLRRRLACGKELFLFLFGEANVRGEKSSCFLTSLYCRSIHKSRKSVGCWKGRNNERICIMYGGLFNVVKKFHQKVYKNLPQFPFQVVKE